MTPIKLNINPYFTSSALENKEADEAANLPLPLLKTAQDFSLAQRSINQLSVEDLEGMEFIKSLSKLEMKHLADRDTLFRFLLFFNYPVSRIHHYFVNHIHVLNGGVNFLKILPSLAECVCPCGTRSSKTGGEKNRRLKLEEEILTKIEQRWKNNKDQKLILVDIGSGCCLQDWVLLSKLLLMGFTNLEIHLVDKEYRVNSEVKNDLLKFFSQFPGVKYDFHFHNSLKIFSQNHADVHADVLLAIDWDKAPSDDKPKLPIHLTKDGFSYFNKHEPNWKIIQENKELPESSSALKNNSFSWQDFFYEIFF